MSPEEERTRGLSRERLVQAALELVNGDGLEALSMRALAERLAVKASSLYWHVRDRHELLELLAESILEDVSLPPEGTSWRPAVVAAAGALRRELAAQKDAARILIEGPDALQRSGVFGALKSHLVGAGLQAVEASDVALMIMTYVIAGGAQEEEADAEVEASRGDAASIAIDSGSRGVILRAGAADMQSLIRVPTDQAAAAPAVVRGEQVVVRRLRGVGKGEIELNPRRPWRFKVQAPTWNTVIDAAGLDVRAIWIDSGAANVECFLPRPRGVVPVHVSSGVVNVALRRPGDAPVTATVHSGAVKVRLDAFSTRITVLDLHWNSDGALGARDRYELDVSSGVVDFKLDTYTPKVQQTDAAPVEAQPKGEPTSALDLLLDGVEARTRAR